MTPGGLKLAGRLRPKQNSAQIGGRECCGSEDFVGSCGLDTRGIQACGLNATLPKLVAEGFEALAGWVALTPGDLKLAGRLLPKHNSAQIGGRAFWELWGLRRQQRGLWLRHQGNLDHSWGKGLIMDLGSDEFQVGVFEWSGLSICRASAVRAMRQGMSYRFVLHWLTEPAMLKQPSTLTGTALRSIAGVMHRVMECLRSTRHQLVWYLASGVV